MNHLEEHLGKSMTVKEVADFLCLDVGTVRKYYASLGGVRFGTAYRFFERRIIDAIQTQQEMGWASEVQPQKKEKNIQHEKGGNRLGKRDGKEFEIKPERDPYGLVD
jgi:hypothetical protein